MEQKNEIKLYEKLRDEYLIDIAARHPTKNWGKS